MNKILITLITSMFVTSAVAAVVAAPKATVAPAVVKPAGKIVDTKNWLPPKEIQNKVAKEKK